MSYNKEIESYGYKILDDVEIVKVVDRFNCQDNLGYKYYISFHIIKSNHTPSPFHTSNPHTLNNIKNWLYIKHSSINLISVAYIDNQSILNWKCSICNYEFEKTWKRVLYGDICPQCALKQRIKRHTLTQEEILQQFREVHGDKYDYSLVKYEHSHKKITVICLQHGQFTILPYSHKQGSGCNLCGNILIGLKSRKKQDEVIEQFKTIHGDKYDYSLAKYEKNNKKIQVICKIHGIFNITPNSHLNGSGCKLCGLNRLITSRKHTQEQVIQNFINVHGDRYDYSLVEYHNSLKKIQVICKLHGIFNIAPASHKAGQGCSLCGDISSGSKRTYTQEQAIQKFVKSHGNYYDYTNTKYLGINKKIIITCPIHGEFITNPETHWNGGRCPLCVLKNRGWTKTKWIKSANNSKNFDSYKVYILKCWNEFELFYKIGRTYANVNQRYKWGKSIPYNYEILEIIENSNGEYIYDLENYLLKLHHKNQLFYKPQITFHGQYECFKNILNINEILVDFNNTICNI